jgi:UDP-N-acetylmuramate: L-alanyl-gamma-D-glutamyl-meso-diaminopimelate ligase
LELHTFSSLNADFMKEYKGAMEPADEAIVFYSRHALELKRMKFLEPKSVEDGFQKVGLKVITERSELEKLLKSENVENTNFIFMSSGNYDGMDILKMVKSES